MIDDMCTKLGVVSQMEQDEYTVFAVVERGKLTSSKVFAVLHSLTEPYLID